MALNPVTTGLFLTLYEDHFMTMHITQIRSLHINQQGDHSNHNKPVKETYCYGVIILASLLNATPSFALSTSISTGSVGNIGTTLSSFPQLPDIPPLEDDGTPPIPGVNLKPLSSSSLKLTWFNNSDREEGFNLYRRQPGGTESLIDTVGPVTISTNNWGEYIDTDLKSDIEYVYRVEAYNSAGTTSSEKRAFTDRKAPPSQLVAQMRILSQNIQGLPTNMDYVDYTIGSTDCEQRGKSFGNGLAITDPAYTLVGLQELYPERLLGNRFTCDPKYVLDEANSTGRYPIDRSIFGLFLEDSSNAILFQPSAGIATGGTGLLSMGPMSIRQGEAWVGNYDGFIDQRSKQGFTFSRVTVPDTGLEVDVYVVHLYSRVTDHCDGPCQRGELEQLAQRIAQESGNSGNPVIVMGDFNLPGPPATPVSGDGLGANYIDLKEALLDPRDLWYENHPNKDGITNGPTEDNLRGQRLDYIFVATDPYLTNNPYSVFIRNRADVSVATGFGDVSDHRGVSATIEIRSHLTLPLYPQISTETLEAEADLEALDSAIETIYTAFQQAEDNARNELEGILELQFSEERAIASSALIRARRRDNSGIPASSDQGNSTNSQNASTETEDIIKLKDNIQTTVENQPFTPHSIRGKLYPNR